MDRLISEQAVIDAIKEWTKYMFTTPILKQIKAIPSAEPKTGHWISHKEHCEINNLRPSGLGSYFWCSECDCGIDSKEWHRNNYNYCPTCGARMSENPTDSKDVIWHDKRNYSEIVVES